MWWRRFNILCRLAFFVTTLCAKNNLNTSEPDNFTTTPDANEIFSTNPNNTTIPPLDYCQPNTDHHPINITTYCNRTRFSLLIHNYRAFVAAVAFDPITCEGPVVLKFTLNDCEAVTIAKANIPNNTVLILNGDTQHLMVGDQIEFRVQGKEVGVQRDTHVLRIKSPCSVHVAQNDIIKMNVVVDITNANCRTHISLQPAAQFYYPSRFSAWWQRPNQLIFAAIAVSFIFGFLMCLTFLCVRRVNRGSGKWMSQRSGTYNPRAVEDLFPAAFPVHFKPADEPTTHMARTPSIPRAKNIFSLRAPPASPISQKSVPNSEKKIPLPT